MHQKMSNNPIPGKRRSRKAPKPPVLTDKRFATLARSGKLRKAALEAIRNQLARGISVTVARGNKIIKRHADGTEEILGTIR